MLSFNQIKLGAVIDVNGQPFQIIKAEHSKTARSGAVLRAKMKNLIDGSVLENTYKQSDTFQEADLSRSKANFMYREGDQFHFMDNETYEQFALDLETVGDISRYVKEGDDVEIMSFNQKPVSLSLPPKVTLKVTQAPPGVKGDTAGNATKRVTVETGYQVDVPLFIKEGEMIRVNTDTGAYSERAN